MKIRLDKLSEAISSARSHIVSYNTDQMKNHSVDVNITEADLNKGIPLTVLTLTAEYEKDNKKHTVLVEVYDDMDNSDPTVTHITKETIKAKS